MRTSPRHAVGLTLLLVIGVLYDVPSKAFQLLLMGVGNATLAQSAPADATYITQTGHVTLTAEQALANLSTGLLKVTTGTGVLSTATTPTDYIATSDSRLSDARAPTTHASTHNAGGGDALAIDASASTGSLRTLGAGATQATAGTDSRLSDTRTPTDGSATNAKLATMATKTYKGRTTAGTGAPEDVAVATLKADLTLVKGDVGLGSVDNTSDAGKPVSTAQQTALDLKANLASPTLTGTPAAPTAAVGTNTTQLATTAYARAMPLDTLAVPTDITTLNATTSLHGLLPKLGGGAVNFLRADGTWAAPPTGLTTLTSSGTQSDAIIATYTAITGLSFTAAASTNYLIDCYVVYTSTAATTGINFAWDTPATPTAILMDGHTKTVATGASEGFSQNSDNVGTATSAAVITTQNLATLHTLFRNGTTSATMSLGFTPETANSVSVIAGSVCQYRVY